MDASSATASHPRVVLIHDWLTGMRGGEKCLQILAKRWPHAQLYTLLHRKGSVSADIENLRLCASWLNRLPFVHRYYRYLLPIMPTVVSNWRLPAADLFVSFSHCVAKGFPPVNSGSSTVPHVCYCFTPMRYAWHKRKSYFGGRLGKWPSQLVDKLLDHIREWDRATAAGVSHFIAISETVRSRIKECYGRESAVIYPPVDTEFYTPAPVPREDFYLVVSALAPYKRIDLAMEACRRLKKRLVVIGSGQDAGRLTRLADDGVQLMGWQSNEVIRDHMRRCKALLFPGEEDFGIVPVEAMACGTPVIALSKGGATETVVPITANKSLSPTGVWFEEESVDSLVMGIESFEREEQAIVPQACRAQALKFAQQRYSQELYAFVDAVMERKKVESPLRQVA